MGGEDWGSDIEERMIGVERLELELEGGQRKIGSVRSDSEAVILVQHLSTGVARCCCQDRIGTELLLSITLLWGGTCNEDFHAHCTNDK